MIDSFDLDYVDNPDLLSQDTGQHYHNAFMLMSYQQNERATSRQSSVGATNGNGTATSEFSMEYIHTPEDPEWTKVTAGTSPISSSSNAMQTPETDFLDDGVEVGMDSDGQSSRSRMSGWSMAGLEPPRTEPGGSAWSDCSDEQESLLRDYQTNRSVSSTLSMSPRRVVTFHPSELAVSTGYNNTAVNQASRSTLTQARPAHFSVDDPWAPGITRHARAGAPSSTVMFAPGPERYQDHYVGRNDFTLDWNSFGSDPLLACPLPSVDDFFRTMDHIIPPHTAHPQELPSRHPESGFQHIPSQGQFGVQQYDRFSAAPAGEEFFSDFSNSRTSRTSLSPVENLVTSEVTPSVQVPSNMNDMAASSSSRSSKSSTNSNDLLATLATGSAHKTKHYAVHNRRQSTVTSRAGGRLQGSHLSPDRAQAANMMRKVGVCWHCKLQRDRCAPGIPCDRCKKRALRPNSDCGLGCRREHLKDLKPVFRNEIYTGLHEQERINGICSSYIRDWSNIEITIHLTPGRGLPIIKCRVYRFTPKDKTLLQQTQWVRDPKTGSMAPVVKNSLPLGLQQMQIKDDNKYDRYIQGVMENHMDTFIERFYHGEKDDYGHRLLRMMQLIQPPPDSDESKALYDAKHLLVSTFILSHTLTLNEDESKTEAMQHVQAKKDMKGNIGDRYTSPRMTNRQLKWHFSRLHDQFMQVQLNRLQQVFGNSKGTEKWTTAFITVLGLAVAFEDIQKNIHIIVEADTDKAFKHDSEYKRQFADGACKEIDRQFQFIMQIFKLKYRGCNPLKDWDVHGPGKLQASGMLLFIQNLGLLIKEKKDFLHNRQFVEISYQNWEQYTARLSGRFLLSF